MHLQNLLTAEFVHKTSRLGLLAKTILQLYGSLLLVTDRVIMCLSSKQIFMLLSLFPSNVAYNNLVLHLLICSYICPCTVSTHR